MTSYNRCLFTCEWCEKRYPKTEQTYDCKHIVCDKCTIKDTRCRSKCPVCWCVCIAKYLTNSSVCSVCCRGLSSNEPRFKCSENHEHCSDCYTQGCLLCQFGRLKEWNTSSYRFLSPNIQRILYSCNIWMEKFEEAQCHYKKSAKKDASGVKSSKVQENIDCMICLDPISSSYRKLEVCGHCFHTDCLNTWFESNTKMSCPTCGHLYGIKKGPQPANGQMTENYIKTVLPGFEKDDYGHHPQTIQITYSFSNGIQGPLNPNPGKPYKGTRRIAYLPNNKEGREVLALLRRAFNDQHVFTIGKSITTGEDNVITWNDIHHKTNISGGPNNFGYPDPTYFLRVRQELADKGYK